MTSAPSYQQRLQEKIDNDILSDLARSEYKTQALTYLAMAKNAIDASPEASMVYAQSAVAYAMLEESRIMKVVGKK